MPGITLTEGADVYHSTLRSPEPGIPIFQINMLGGNDQLYTHFPCSLRAFLGTGDDFAQFNGMFDLFVYGEAGNDVIDFLKGFWSLTLDGGDGADRINFITNASDITATGGAGNDSFYGNGYQHFGTITGGTGDDFFSGFGSGESNITLAGGSGNDTYVIDPAAPPTIVETAGEGVDTIVLLYAAPYTAPANIERVIVQESPPPHFGTHVRSDFNGDGRSDILWRNDNGIVTDWLGQTDGSFIGNTSNAYISVGAGWQISGVGDFDGDGQSDVLWRNDDGRLAGWLGQVNGGFISNAGFNHNVSTNWQVSGIGDFDGDGRDDILWRYADGSVIDWLGRADGRFDGNTDDTNIKVGLDWHFAGIGDFNGDGRDDVLWRRDNGDLAEWLGQEDGGFSWNASFDQNVASSLQVAGIGDFNGDDRDDILWRDADGTVTNALGLADGNFDGNTDEVDIMVGLDWQVAGVGDYDGDGRDDVLWRRDNGALAEWLGQADGSFILNASFNYSAATSWQVQSPDVM